MEQIKEKLSKCRLFEHLTMEEIEKCILCSGGSINNYKKESMIFTQFDKPKNIYVLLGGRVAICKDTVSGNRVVVNEFSMPGDVFAEVYLFLDKEVYDYYSVTMEESYVLTLPKNFFFHTCKKCCNHHEKLIYNMLHILAEKAYFLNGKVALLSSGTLRQKIASYLLSLPMKDNMVTLPMKREQMAAYLNVARPSLSRELLKMQEEGLIIVENSKITIPVPDLLEEL